MNTLIPFNNREHEPLMNVISRQDVCEITGIHFAPYKVSGFKTFSERRKYSAKTP